jgi:hypothetical protein
MAALGEELLSTVNKLQDLVFNTIGNDSLDLPQIVSNTIREAPISMRFILTQDFSPSLSRLWWVRSPPVNRLS